MGATWWKDFPEPEKPEKKLYTLVDIGFHVGRSVLIVSVIDTDDGNTPQKIEGLAIAFQFVIRQERTE